MPENNNQSRNPRVFISYSWDSPEHKLWVESFAQELRKSGIDARLDAWRDESQSIDDFMMVELERADFVLAVCTPEFKRKIVENAEGTATASGFEIGTAAALRRMGGKDVIPILRAGEWTDSAPSSLLSYRFYDFSKADVSQEFTQLRDRLLGHIRRPPELGEASGPAAAPELPDIFAKGSEPAPQPTAPPVSGVGGGTPRSGPPTEQVAQPSQVIIQQAPAGYGKGKVWGIVGAIILGLVVLWNITPDPDEPVDASPQTVADTTSAAQSDPDGDFEAQASETQQAPGVQEIDMDALAAALIDAQRAAEESSTVMVSAEDRWTIISGSAGCGIEKNVADRSWVQLVFELADGFYTLGTSNDAWGNYVQTGELYESMVVFQFDDDPDTAFIADVFGYEYQGLPGAFAIVGEDVANNLRIHEYLNVYLNADPWQDNFIMSFDLTGSLDAAERLISCVAEL